MTTTEAMLHQLFRHAIAEYHPFANYRGFEVLADGFAVYYQGAGEVQYMLVDVEGNIVDDTTLGTTRTLEIFEFGVDLLNTFFNGQGNQY
ncbi:MAG: hypothetical protein F6K45_22925 [Kamptonema sp. SIO1D9]|nr:hypothetical protein [Kamptonema sp. SIO1D9]